MAKSRGKRRSSVSSANPRSYSEYLKNDEGPSETKPVRPQQTVTVAKPDSVEDDTASWRSEYSQVFADLRQLLVISAALFVLMIVLGLFI